MVMTFQNIKNGVITSRTEKGEIERRRVRGLQSVKLKN